jgi:hypothetical protein
MLPGMTNEKRDVGYWAGVFIGIVLMTPFLYLVLLGPLLFLNLTGTLDDSVYRIASKPVMLWGYYVGGPAWLWTPWSSYMAWWGALAGVMP